MKTAKLFDHRENAEKYIAEHELTTAKIVEYWTDRSDPKWTRKSFAVQVSRQEYFDKLGS